MPSFEVYGLGQCALDYIGKIDAYPPPDVKLSSLTWSAASSGDKPVSHPLRNLWKGVIRPVKDDHASLFRVFMLSCFRDYFFEGFV